MELENLIALSQEHGGSDLHISVGEVPRVRASGRFILLDTKPLQAETLMRFLQAKLTGAQQKELAEKMTLDVALSLDNGVRLRGNIFYQARGLAAAFRFIPCAIPTLDGLALPAIFKQWLTLRQGLILVTGATGSGKSTTLAAMVDYLNTQYAYHIITIEDPIEFLHASRTSLIHQREIKQHTPNFSDALRAALREDPDVILLGEMRDLETIRLALTAAETGHLVLATLHTSGAPRAIHRILDVFPGSEKNYVRNLLAESLQAVICQQWVMTPVGKRVMAFEMLRGTHAVRNLIREDKIAQLQNVMQTSADAGMCTLAQYLEREYNEIT